jgi:hypothetical protein
MNTAQLRQKLIEAICIGPMSTIEERIEKVLLEIEKDNLALTQRNAEIEEMLHRAIALLNEANTVINKQRKTK